ncbi:MAG: M28 family peptidase [Acidobacteriota bacterium]
MWVPWLVVLSCVAAAPSDSFDGEKALAHVRRLVELGPRPVGSEAHQKMQQYLLESLSATGLATSREDFTGETPGGPIPMSNLMAVHRGDPERLIIIAGHYDTKRFDRFIFVGANDGGSSAGVILELARVVSSQDPRPSSTVWFVLLDGEEAMGRWSASDSLYGSRHLASRLGREGKLGKVRAFLLVDLVGDRDLGILREGYSTRWLQDMVWSEAARLGYGRHFLSRGYPVEDDHIPFVRQGVPAVDLIDFEYGPQNRFWHSPEDTLDKLSAQSLKVIGDTLLAVLARLDERP